MRPAVVAALIAGVWLQSAAGGASAQQGAVRDFGFRIESPTCTHIAELAPFSSFVGIDADHSTFHELMGCVRSRNLKAVVDLTDLLFLRGSPAGGPSPPTRLRPDYLERWNRFVIDHRDLLAYDSVWAFYLADEPFWNGVPLAELEQVDRLARSTFPLIPTMTSLGTEDIRRLPPAMAQGVLDIVGYHVYASPGDPLTDPAYRADLALLLARFPGRQVMIVADAWWADGLHGAAGIDIEQTGERGRQFLAVAEEIGATALGAFVWDSFGGNRGLRDLPEPAVRDYLAIGAETTGRCGVPDTVSPLDGPRVLFLHDCRFHVTARWRIPWTGEVGQAVAVPLSSDSGLFWFFTDANVELMVKLLDGRALNDHWWLFWAAMTSLEVELEVSDTATGRVRTYSQPTIDTSAFTDG